MREYLAGEIATYYCGIQLIRAEQYDVRIKEFPTEARWKPGGVGIGSRIIREIHRPFKRL